MQVTEVEYIVQWAEDNRSYEHKYKEQMCITQPSLSHSISLLEQELGGTLFEKQGRRSVLTPKGSQFLF